ncbi:hypothetical protein VTL71DRAFT_10938 [Oculimacula yallundae]|uniref:Uncharacterized protein n=1 Tax=Oculimacula yallundae TaxID=86028 RepID=A0ABR4CUV2_9HELO
MIELGLARISTLLKHTPQTWKAIHVAGTNGKGSICAYLSAMLDASGVRCGRFTSPHLIDRWDCININQKTVRKSVFDEAEKSVLRRNDTESLGATEFELLTATAFEAFAKEKIEMGVIEVGLGGRLDATNAMEKKAVTVISKIGLDHQSFLGNTIEKIAREKAGIMRPGVPCVVDSTNSPSVLQVVQDYAGEIRTDVVLSSTESSFFDDLSQDDFEPHQWQNLACAYAAFNLAYTKLQSPLHKLLPAIQDAALPGRLQTVDIRSLTGWEGNTLLDGAHNVQSAEALGAYVDARLRTSLVGNSEKRNINQKVTWVLAASKGKELEGILKPLLRSRDCVIAVEFGTVDGMPWVQAMPCNEIMEAAYEMGVQESIFSSAPWLFDCLNQAHHLSINSIVAFALSFTYFKMPPKAPKSTTLNYKDRLAQRRSRLTERKAKAKAKLQCSKGEATKTPPSTPVESSPEGWKGRTTHNLRSCPTLRQKLEKTAAHAHTTYSMRPQTRSLSPAKRKTDDAGEASRAKRSKSDPMEYSPDAAVEDTIPTQATVPSEEDVTKKRSKSDPMDYSSDAAARQPVSPHTALPSENHLTKLYYLSPTSSVSDEGYQSTMQSDVDAMGDSDHLSPASSIDNDASVDKAIENLELQILQVTADNLKSLRHALEKAEECGAELSRCADNMGKVMDQYLARTKAKYRSHNGGSNTLDQSQIPILTPRSKEIAKELVRRLKSGYGYAEIVNPFLETEHSPNLFYLMQVREGVKDLPYNIAPAIWFLLPTLRVERENAYHALAAHLYITHKTASSPKDMERQLKQSVIHFFDKSFTYQVATVYGIQVSLQGPLLRLGGDAVFKSTDGLNTGGESFRELDNYNQEVWQDLVLRSVELAPRVDKKHTFSKRARAESSISSLGLTSLFLDDEKDAEYEGDDEAILEKQIQSPGHKDLRKDSAIDVEYSPFHTSAIGSKVQPHVILGGGGEHSKASDGVSTTPVQKIGTDGDQEVVGERYLHNIGDHIKLVSARMHRL